MAMVCFSEDCVASFRAHETRVDKIRAVSNCATRVELDSSHSKILFQTASTPPHTLNHISGALREVEGGKGQKPQHVRPGMRWPGRESKRVLG